MLLDRHADVFLARRADADGWLIKPLDSFRIRRAAEALLAGGEYDEGTAVVEPPVDEPLVEDTAETASEETEATTDADDTVATEAENAEAAEA